MIQKKPNEIIILLHGLMRSKTHMFLMAKRMRDQGYKVLNISYPSLSYNIPTLAEIVWQQINNQIQNFAKIHFVGYSMGGLIARLITEKYQPKFLENIVLIGTPNQGSEISDLLQNNFFYKKIFGKAGQQLTTTELLFDNVNGDNYNIGCISGVLKGIYKILYPVSFFMLKGENDGRVSLESSKLENKEQWIINNCPHFFLPYSQEVTAKTLDFLQNGTFGKKY